MLQVKFRKSTMKFEEGSLERMYLDDLKGTRTLDAFKKGGEAAWRRFWEPAPLLPDDSGRSFFLELLGQELCLDLESANPGYSLLGMLHGRYNAWGRANICDLVVKREDEE